MIGTVAVSSSDGSFAKAADGVEIGGDVKYRLRLENKMTTDLKVATAINVLPREGDKSIVKNEAGEYTDRGSKFSVFLKGPITPPEGFSVVYSTEKPATDALDVNNQAFVPADEITDWSKVTMFKWTMNE